jgi:hypothetical protein
MLLYSNSKQQLALVENIITVTNRAGETGILISLTPELNNELSGTHYYLST